MSKTLELAQQLIARQSISPDDAGCQELLIERLKAMGFKIESLPFGDVTNFWARRGDQSPLFVFAGHTDVVPPGPIEKWSSDPFTPEIRDGFLYGRGAADMKSSLAAMVTACERFLENNSDHSGSIGFLITSDEEAVAIDGTVKVLEHLTNRNEKIDWCVVGEASSTEQVGDIVKNGRRGSLSGKLIIHGIQGHIAYPDIADNPIHKSFPILLDLTNQVWDKGNEFFQPTSFQISNIHAGTGANNVIPADLTIDFNFRYSTAVTAEELQTKLLEILNKHEIEHTIHWHHSGKPFLTSKGKLIDATKAAIKDVMNFETTLSTAGGTSDGRFIAPTGAEVIEIGPCNETIHQIDECVKVDDLELVSKVYESVIKKLLGD